MKDERYRHGAVGKSSSEQHFRKSAAITFIVVKFLEPYTAPEISPSATGSYGRQVADKMQVNFEIFKTNCTPKHSIFRFI